MHTLIKGPKVWISHDIGGDAMRYAIVGGDMRLVQLVAMLRESITPE